MIRFFRITVPTSVVVLLLSELVLLTFCYAVAAYLVLEVDPYVFLVYDGGLGRILVVVATILLSLHALNLYTDIRPASRVALVLAICQAIGFALIVQAVLTYVSPSWMLSRRIMMWGSGIALPSLSGWRFLYSALFTRAFGGDRVLFVGANPLVEEIALEISGRPELGLVPLGYLDDRPEGSEPLPSAKLLGRITDLAEVASALRPDRIVVGMTERRARLPVQELLDQRFAGVQIEETGSMYELVCGRVSTKELRPAQLIFSGELGPKRNSVIRQSLYAPALALFGFIVTLPVMLAAAILVKLTSRGPALYRQTRVGLNGKLFTVYKFRSMRDGAEASTGAVWASPRDPRITWVGRWLRRLRIDEFPQLWNVLRGDMTVVGPRPERPEFVQVLAERIPYYRQRHSVKPGITGWAQIHHPYGDSLEDAIVKLEYDLYYIKRISLSLDLYIMFQTLKIIFQLRGR